MSTIDHGIDANRALLDQALRLLDRLTDNQYARRRGTWAPVGAQYRHVLEHYQCLLTGLESGAVNYDGRPRDAALETSRERAAETTREIQAGLGALAGRSPGGPLRVQLRTTPDASEPEWSASTLGRELQFLMSHTVHHHALIKLLLAGDEIDPGADFGVAPSTLAHARTLG